MAVVKCESCGENIRIGDKYAGRRGKCPVCKTSFIVPLGGESLKSGTSGELMGAGTTMKTGVSPGVPATCRRDLIGGHKAAPRVAPSESISSPNRRFAQFAKTAVLFGVILTVSGIGLALGVSVKTSPRQPNAGLSAKAAENSVPMHAEQPAPISPFDSKPASPVALLLNADVPGKTPENPPLTQAGHMAAIRNIDSRPASSSLIAGVATGVSPKNDAVSTQPSALALGYLIQLVMPTNTATAPSKGKTALIVLVSIPSRELIPDVEEFEAFKKDHREWTSPRENCVRLAGDSFTLRTQSDHQYTAAGLAVWNKEFQLGSSFVTSSWRGGAKIRPTASTVLPVCFVLANGDFRPPFSVSFGPNPPMAVPTKCLTQSDVIAALGSDYRFFEEIEMPKLDLSKFQLPRIEPPPNIEIPRFDVPTLDSSKRPAPRVNPPLKPTTPKPSPSPSVPARPTQGVSPLPARPPSQPAMRATSESAQSLWLLAQSYESRKMPTPSGEILQRIVAEYPKSDWAQKASLKLQQQNGPATATRRYGL